MFQSALPIHRRRDFTFNKRDGRKAKKDTETLLAVANGMKNGRRATFARQSSSNTDDIRASTTVRNLIQPARTLYAARRRLTRERHRRRHLSSVPVRLERR